MSAEPGGFVRLDHYLAAPPRNGYSPVESADWTGVQMLGLGCLTPEGFVPRQLKNAPSSVSESHVAVLRDGDILMSRANTRDLVGLVGMYRDVGTLCIYPDLMMRLRPAGNCVPEFLEIVLRARSVRQGIQNLAQGTSESMVKISSGGVCSLPVPRVPLADQHRIVEIMNSFSEAQAASVSVLSKLRIAKGAIWDSFERGTSEGTLRNLLEVCSLPTGQVDPRSMPYFSQPLLAPDHIESGTGRLIARVTAGDQGAVSGKYIVHPGDVVLSKIRPALRKVVVADFTGTCSADMYPLRTSPDVIPEYLFSALLGDRFSRFSESVSGRTGIPKLNRGDLGGYSVRVPSLGVQRRVVELLSKFDSRCRIEEMRQRKEAALADALLADFLGGAGSGRRYSAS
ncbi:Type I restriction-modification system, specificity subunit S [Streptomyces globisporus]|uniref:Type I restriction-modification system, specificity subunit S n=1 Tax=Streptomyces globisporus TaxID=1908 RepID=A0ABM9GZ05_STRGL|nr:restriction endonuclease subunit S [Streptomyces globisporus]CAH9416141.1 Type I restriction-modification system, specificity subunit S [Streptomyces globisporus]